MTGKNTWSGCHECGGVMHRQHQPMKLSAPTLHGYYCVLCLLIQYLTKRTIILAVISSIILKDHKSLIFKRDRLGYKGKGLETCKTNGMGSLGRMWTVA